MQVVKIVAFHFNAKKEDFFKVLDVENSDSSDDVLIALIECCKAKLTLVQGGYQLLYLIMTELKSHMTC